MTKSEFLLKYNLPSQATEDLNNLLVLEARNHLEDLQAGFLEGLATGLGEDPIAQEVLHRLLLAVYNPSNMHPGIPEA